jgi:poly(3-hydroxybutyrate) depolymerase
MIPFVIAEEQYKFTNWDGVDLPVFVAKPGKINKATRLVVVMHGRKRNAEEYRDQWIEAAKDLNLLVVVPEFSEKNFPEVWGFNYGNVMTPESEPIEEKLHAFSSISPLANEAIEKFELKSNNWGIYGHGAGAHFVHRYVLHQPEANHTLAIAANLGWYLSMTDQQWPFGLTNSGIEATQLKQAFGKYFLLMLGKADTSTKPNSPYVKEHWDTINLQGEHRLARGRNFFKTSVEKSKEVDQFFKWGMVEVPTTKGHGNTKQMVPYAAEMFFARLR